MDALIAALQNPEAYPHPTGPITLMETHISWVVLTGSFAYKVKKPVSLGFLDFSCLEQRRHFCQEEVRLNQRLAPELYLDVVEIHGPPEQASLKGTGPVVEVAVRMHQFAQEGLLPQALVAGTLTVEHLERFAERLAAFHGGAAVAPSGGPFGTPQAVVAPALANIEVLQRLYPHSDGLARLREWTQEEARRLEAIFLRRRKQGRVREGHGDLHLGNLVLHRDEVVGFDCLEFNPALRWIDVLSDVAFLAMDLQAHGQEVWAARVLNRWLAACGDYGSLLTWPWYLTYRALVRAKVLALRLEQLEDQKPQTLLALQRQMEIYLEQARRSSGSLGPGALLLTHGVSGSGKSFLASQLCQRHGWIQLRSDVERRRLFGGWGISLEPPRQGEVYSPVVSEELYGELLPSAAESALRAGFTVVVDATFLKRNQRNIFFNLADRLQLPFLILDFPINLEKARERLEKRQSAGKDPSQADATILMQQWREVEPLDEREATLQVQDRELIEVEALLAARIPGIIKTTR